MKISTVAYKGSKRKLLSNIEKYAAQINARSFFDGFSGTGIVSAHMRSKGYVVSANDKNYSSSIYGNVFLGGFDQNIVDHHLSAMNGITPKIGWLTENYSGTKVRQIRGTGGKSEDRPLGYMKKNSMKLDAARDYVEQVNISPQDKDALIFSVILAADKVFNNTSDQKSSLKTWSKASQKDVLFTSPTLISGPVGQQHIGEITTMNLEADLVYLDPPYTHGVLYSSCYHLNDSIAKWDKPKLDMGYALPRPESVCFRKNGQKAGGFYNKSSAKQSFESIFKNLNCRRSVLSYSDAPRNTLTIKELSDICSSFGKTTIEARDHRICMQPEGMNKISSNLKEFFIITDFS